MKKLLPILLCCACFLAIKQEALGQSPDSAGKAADSVNAGILSNYGKQIAQSNGQLTADSVNAAKLEAAIAALKSSEGTKRDALMQELARIRQGEAARIAGRIARMDSLRATAKAFPVSGLLDDTLFLIYSRLGSFSAHDRADAITARIRKLAAISALTADSLTIAESETTADIAFGESIIVSVSDNDALWADTTRSALATRYRQIIARDISEYQKATGFWTLAKELGLALLVLVFMVGLLYGIVRLARFTAARIRAQEGVRVKGVHLKNYTLFDARRQLEVLLWLNSALKWLVMLLAIYLALPVLFGLFPWTQHFADTLFGYILNPLRSMGSGLLHHLPNLITIIVIVFVFRYLLKGLKFLKDEVAAGHLHLSGFYPDWANPTYQIIRILIIAFMIVVIFPYLPGSSSPVFRGVSVFLGFLFTFSSAGSLSNIIAGLVLTYMRLFKIGDL